MMVKKIVTLIIKHYMNTWIQTKLTAIKSVFTIIMNYLIQSIMVSNQLLKSLRLHKLNSIFFQSS